MSVFVTFFFEHSVSIEECATIFALQDKINNDKGQKKIKGLESVDTEGELDKFQPLTMYADTPSTQYPDIFSNEEDRQSNKYTAELLHQRQKFGHCKFWKIIKMSKQVVILTGLGKEKFQCDHHVHTSSQILDNGLIKGSRSMMHTNLHNKERTYW